MADPLAGREQLNLVATTPEGTPLKGDDGTLEHVTFRERLGEASELLARLQQDGGARS